jgi:hypothetical protein
MAHRLSMLVVDQHNPAVRIRSLSPRTLADGQGVAPAGVEAVFVCAVSRTRDRSRCHIAETSVHETRTARWKVAG